MLREQLALERAPVFGEQMDERALCRAEPDPERGDESQLGVELLCGGWRATVHRERRRGFVRTATLAPASACTLFWATSTGIYIYVYSSIAFVLRVAFARAAALAYMRSLLRQSAPLAR